MIIQHTADGNNILFNPEDMKERKTLENIPGFLRQGLVFYAPSKHNVVYNLYKRLKRKTPNIKYTKEVKSFLENGVDIKDLPESFKFHTTPLAHQLLALRFGYTYSNFGLLLEPGLGKTKVILDYIWLIQAKKSLIICPKPLRFVWEDETDKHRPELTVHVIQTTDWDREKSWVDKADVIVINYDKAVSLLDHLLRIPFDFLGVDEGLVKNTSTDRTKAITKLSKGIPNRSIMSGTLVNNSPLDIFGPVRILEPSLVGESFFRFKEEYALLSRHNRHIVVGFKNVSEVKEILNSCSIIMRKEEWLKDLPPKEFNHIYVQMGDQQRDYYQRLANNYLLQIEEVDAEIEVDNPLSVLIKLTQISNGFVYYTEDLDETLEELYGEESKRKKKVDRKTYKFKDQPKIGALLKLIKSEEFNRPEDKNDVPAGNVKTIPRESDSGIGPTELHISSLGKGTSPDERVDQPCNGSGSGENKVLSKRNRSSTRAITSADTSKSGSIQSDDCNSFTLSSGDNLQPIQVNRDGVGSSNRSSRYENGYDERVEQGAETGVSRTCGENSLSPNRRAIIWFNMAAELELLQSALSDAGIPFLTIAGGDKHIGEKVRLFNKDASYRFLLCQAKTINYGVTIMGSDSEDGEDVVPDFDPVVSDEIFYSLNFSLEVFLQQQDRIHRIGQKRKCRYWILLTNSPIERRIANRLEEKLLCNKEILIDISKSLDLTDL